MFAADIFRGFEFPNARPSFSIALRCLGSDNISTLIGPAKLDTSQNILTFIYCMPIITQVYEQFKYAESESFSMIFEAFSFSVRTCPLLQIIVIIPNIRTKPRLNFLYFFCPVISTRPELLQHYSSRDRYNQHILAITGKKCLIVIILRVYSCTL